MINTNGIIQKLGHHKFFRRKPTVKVMGVTAITSKKLLGDKGSRSKGTKLIQIFIKAELSISNEASNKDPTLDNFTDYQKLMGKLIYLTNTRPGISYDVHCLSQFMHSPLKSHLKIAFKLLRYLKSCPGLGIHVIKNSGMNLKVFSDAG
ncbi:hypothetical protein Tco_1492561 [Tanacetum coccineum]